MKTEVKFGLLAGALVILFVLVLQTCYVIAPTEEAAVQTFGVVNEDVVGPGMHLKVPIVQRIRKINKSPIDYSKTIPIGEKALITKEGQSLGITFTLTWKYKDNSVVEVANKYATKESLYSLISNPCKQAFQSSIGRLEALEFVGKQDEVIAYVLRSVSKDIARLNLPIETMNLVIDNITWDPGFESQIKKTAKMRAQVEQAKQDAAIEAANQKKKIATAQAERAAAQEKADMNLYTATKAKEAKMQEADGIAYYNSKIAQNNTVQQQQWKHEEQMAYYNKWDGRQVPNYIPLAPNGAIVELKGN